MSKIRQFFTDASKSIKVYPKSIANAIEINGGSSVQDHIDKAVVTTDHKTRVGTQLIFENDLTLTAGANESLYIIKNGIGHYMLHNGNIGSATAGNSVKVGGLELSAIELTVNYMNATTVYRRYTVGTKWVHARVFVSTEIDLSTPYYKPIDWCAYVNGAGDLEVYGYGGAFTQGQFVNANVLIIK